MNIQKGDSIMFCIKDIIPLSVILNRSVVYVKGINPTKISFSDKRKIAEHIKLWNIIANSMKAENSGDDNIINAEDIINYVKGNKVLASTISLNAILSDCPSTHISKNDKVLYLIRSLTAKISILFYADKCDYKKLFIYIRALHHLPKCLLSLNDRQKISEEEAVSYMEKELEKIEV